jgi:hypothetical protein
LARAAVVPAPFASTFPTVISDSRRAVAARRFLYLFDGKVLLFSESAMIRAPNSLIVVRSGRCSSTYSTAGANVSYKMIEVNQKVCLEERSSYGGAVPRCTSNVRLEPVTTRGSSECVASNDC